MWTRRIFVVAFWGLLSAGTARAETDIDPVLDFYRSRAGSVWSARNPFEAGVSFSYRLSAVYKSVNSEGQVVDTQRSQSIVYCSFGQIDSTVATVPPEKSIEDLVLAYPNVFRAENRFNFFPNDTGGPELSLGFDSPDATAPEGAGLAVIDRSGYYLRWLFVHYPDREDFRRFSRSYRFAQSEGFVFPDSVWVVGAKEGILSLEHFRIEATVDQFVVYR